MKLPPRLQRHQPSSIDLGIGDDGGLTESQQRSASQEDWLTPYLDLITLLLAVFVFLYAYGSSNSASQKHANTQEVLENRPAGSRVSERLTGEVGRTNEEVTEVQQRFAQEIRKALSGISLNRHWELKVSRETVNVSIGEDLLYLSGRAELRPEGRRLMRQLLPALRGTNYQIVVEGHTDNIPIKTQEFPSNWELSTARASRVVRFLIDKGITPTRFAAVGYGETRPIASNDVETERRKNRRVNLVISLAP